MRTLRSLALLLVVSASVGATTLARAAVMTPDWPYKAKEFAILEHNGEFHLFYMRRDATQPIDGAFVDLGHATSNDLMHWTQHPPVIPIRPNNWDNREIWAPHVIERAGVYYMFYTAVTHTPPSQDLHQRIGLATSTDLYNWTRYDAPVFECADVDWTYCDPTTPAGGEFRDPFVMSDPYAPGNYLMYFVAREDIDRNQYLIGAARSTGDLTQWTSIAPLTNLAFAKTGSYVIESPTLLQHGRRWYLFYTTWNTDPIQFQIGTNPLVGPVGWGPTASLLFETGWTITPNWFGPETFSFGGLDYLAAVSSATESIVLWQIVWGENGHFTLAQTAVVGVEPAPPNPPAWRLECAPATPGWDHLDLTVVAPGPGRARVEVRDVTGRRCRQLLDGDIDGATHLSWDGRDARGVELGSGVYFVTLEATGARVTRRVVRIR